MAEIDFKQIARLETVLVALQEVVDALRGQSVTISPEAAKRIENFRRELRCLFCELPLGKGKSTRGCHQVCYTKLQRRINRGEISLQQAVDKGWINPVAEAPGRKSGRPDPMRDSPPLPEELEARAAAAEAHAEKQVRFPSKKKRRDKSRDSH